MPITIEEVDAHLKALELPVNIPDAPENLETHRFVAFQTESYVDKDGSDSAVIWIIVDDDGSYMHLRALNVCNVRDCAHEGPVFAALLEIATMTRNLKFEYNPDDGEISACADIAIADGTVTSEQLDMSLCWEPTSSESIAAETAELAAKLGGINELRRLVHE